MRYKELSPFQKALVESVLDEYESVPAEENIRHEFSAPFLHRVKQLIKKSDTKMWHYVNTPIKKIILIAIMIALLAITAVAVPVVREAIIDFFIEEREEGVYGITFDPEQAAMAPQQIEICYGPANIPEGFTLVAEEKSVAAVCLMWMNEKGETILYVQDFIPQNASDSNWIGIDADGSTRESRIIGRYLAEVFYFEDTYAIFWTDNQYLYSAELSKTIPFETAESLINSMTELGKP